MHTATRRRFAAAVIVLSAAFAGACAGENPAGVSPSGARFNGGVTFGSGSLVPAPDDSETTTAGGGENTTAADSTSTARGGATFGSGG